MISWLTSLPVYAAPSEGINCPDESEFHYDYDFDFIAWGLKNTPFTKEQLLLAKKKCLHYNLNQRLLGTRWEYEQGLVSGHVENWYGKMYFVKGNGDKTTLQWVQDRCCGYGQPSHERPFPTKFLGFEKQVTGFCWVTRKYWRRYHYLPYILQAYTPGGVEGYCKVWKRLFDKK